MNNDNQVSFGSGNLSSQDSSSHLQETPVNLNSLHHETLLSGSGSVSSGRRASSSFNKYGTTGTPGMLPPAKTAQIMSLRGAHKQIFHSSQSVNRIAETSALARSQESLLMGPESLPGSYQGGTGSFDTRGRANSTTHSTNSGGIRRRKDTPQEHQIRVQRYLEIKRQIADLKKQRSEKQEELRRIKLKESEFASQGHQGSNGTKILPTQFLLAVTDHEHISEIENMERELQVLQSQADAYRRLYEDAKKQKLSRHQRRLRLEQFNQSEEKVRTIKARIRTLREVRVSLGHQSDSNSSSPRNPTCEEFNSVFLKPAEPIKVKRSRTLFSRGKAYIVRQKKKSNALMLDNSSLSDLSRDSGLQGVPPSRSEISFQSPVGGAFVPSSRHQLPQETDSGFSDVLPKYSSLNRRSTSLGSLVPSTPVNSGGIMGVGVGVGGDNGCYRYQPRDIEYVDHINHHIGHQDDMSHQSPYWYKPRDDLEPSLLYACDLSH